VPRLARVPLRTIALASTLVLAACHGPLPHPRLSPQATSALTPIDSVPPPGRVELIPDRPAGADAWVDGEWLLRHGRWYWLLGRWVKTPADATYCPWVVVYATDGTPFYAPSMWRDARGAEIPPPAGLAFATASGEAVVSPEGEPEDTGRVIKTAPARRPRPVAP
jgi:hypothetical protein